MAAHGYDTGRLNLPFVGICTFGKCPYVEDWDAIDADVAVLGAPFDFGTQWRAGARFGPRAIREASTLFSFGHAGAYDHEDDAIYLPKAVRIVDIGDADIVHTDTMRSHANIEFGVRKILAAGALPGRARRRPFRQHPLHQRLQRSGADPHRADRRPSRLRRRAPRRALRPRQPDAPRGGKALRHRPDPARHPQRLLDRPRGLRRTPARMGSDILSVRQMRKLGVDGRARAHSRRRRCYLSRSTSTASIPRSRPGTGTPSHGGFLYYEVLELLAGLAKRAEVVGIDLVEVAPDYDHTGTTAILAAQLLLNIIGRVFTAHKSLPG